MRPRQPSIPRLWLMTDERLGDDWPGGGLWTALARLPRGAGVVFRHHATPPAERRRLLAKVARLCRARRLVLVTAGARRHDGRVGTHGRPGAVTWPAHDRREAIAGLRAGARVLFVSPVFATRSHPGAPALGPVRAALIVRGLPAVTIALGGMDARRFRRLRPLGFDGWAAIDAWQAAKPAASPPLPRPA
ncbi:MAG: thiamine phosphate synthase [Janthinobacterium lividum]